MTPFILSLDISSTAIGWCLHNGAVLAHGVIRLSPNQHIGARCCVARDALEKLLDQHAVDLVAVESPVARFASAIIPQCRVSGAILELAARLDVLACEITPAAAKLALAGDGAASKQQMLMAAAAHFGYDMQTLAYAKHRSDWIAYRPGNISALYSEHEADALGVAIGAAEMVEVVG
jgi:Holliday junction resolvasome RuvABC endonuclease subunit